MSSSTHALVILNADGDSGIVIAHCTTVTRAERMASDINRIAENDISLTILDGVIASKFPIGRIFNLDDIE